MYNPLKPAGSILNRSDYEFVELRNTGSDLLSLTGVRIEGETFFLFDDGDVKELAAGEFVLIVKNRPAFESVYGTGLPVAGEFISSLGNKGSLFMIVNDLGETILEVTYDNSRGWPIAADGLGHSLVPLDSAMADEPEGSLGYGGNWRASATIWGSPGKPDPILTPGVLLNEITAHTDIDFPPYDSNDWIELYNASESDVLLNHWYLSDDPTDLKKWEIPANTSISSGGRISFDEIHDFHQPITEGFGLNKAGEQVLLSYLPGTSEDRVVDAVQFKGQENGLSLGRTPDGGAYWDIMFPTRDTPNGERLVSLVISELMHHPETEDASHEYVELYNPTPQAIDLWNETGPWRVNGGIDLTFPGDMSIPGGGYLLLVNFDPANTTALTNFTDHYGLDPAKITLLGPYQGNLSNQGDRVAIERPQDSDDPLFPDAISWVVVDEVIYFDQSPWPSSPDGGGRSLQRDSANRPGNDPTNPHFSPGPGRGTGTDLKGGGDN